MLPLVGSMMTPPGLSLPSFSAASIIAIAILSFTLPPGLKDSTFATTSALPPESFSRFESLTSGVLPISSRTEFAILLIQKVSIEKRVSWLQKKGKLNTSHRYNLLLLLPSGPGRVQRELVVYDLPGTKVGIFSDITNLRDNFPDGT